MYWLWIILVGAIAGWLAGQVMRGAGFGLLGNIIVGILGAIIGGWLFDALDVFPGGGTLGAIFMAFVGAVVLLFIAGLIRR